MELGVVWEIRVDPPPKEVLQNFLQGMSTTSCGGSNPLTSQSNTAVGSYIFCDIVFYVICHVVLHKFLWIAHV